jgi:hypothetical protein
MSLKLSMGLIIRADISWHVELTGGSQRRTSFEWGYLLYYAIGSAERLQASPGAGTPHYGRELAPLGRFQSFFFFSSRVLEVPGGDTCHSCSCLGSHGLLELLLKA